MTACSASASVASATSAVCIGCSMDASSDDPLSTPHWQDGDSADDDDVGPVAGCAMSSALSTEQLDRQVPRQRRQSWTPFS